MNQEPKGQTHHNKMHDLKRYLAVDNSTTIVLVKESCSWKATPM